MTAVQIECLAQTAGSYWGPEPAYRATCPACGTTGETRTNPVQAKDALADIHGTCTAAAISLPEEAR